MRCGKAFVAVVFCLAGSVAHAQATTLPRLEQLPSVGTALAEVTDLNTAFWEAFAARDLWSMGRLWEKSEDASAIFPATSAPLFGWENVRESFKRSFAHNRDIKIKPRVLGASVAGEVAWLVGAARFEAMQTQTGQPILVDRLLSTTILAKSEGRWRVVHFHAHVPDFALPDTTHHMPRPDVAVVRRPADDVERASMAFHDAFANQDLPGMVRVWADGDVSAIHPSNRTFFVGRDQVIASWERAFADIDTLQITSRTSVKKARGSMAWLVEASEFHAVPANMGSTMHLHNVLSTQIFARDGGQWRMTHYHGQIGFSFDHAD
jgi:ketosteroid isomerase-like protein